MEFMSRVNGEFKTQLKLNSIASLCNRNIPLFKIWFVIGLNCRNKMGNETGNNNGGVPFELGFVLLEACSVFSSLSILSL